MAESLKDDSPRYTFIRGQGDSKQATNLNQLKGYKATLIAFDPTASESEGRVVVLMERET